MKKRIDMRSLVIGALLGAAIVFSVGAVTDAGKRKAWEYRSYTYEGVAVELARANNLGEEGWELVCSAPDSGPGSGAGCLISRRKK
jgi:hypothetical protein